MLAGRLEQINKATFDSYVGTLERGQKGWLAYAEPGAALGNLRELREVAKTEHSTSLMTEMLTRETSWRGFCWRVGEGD